MSKIKVLLILSIPHFPRIQGITPILERIIHSKKYDYNLLIRYNSNYKIRGIKKIKWNGIPSYLSGNYPRSVIHFLIAFFNRIILYIKLILKNKLIIFHIKHEIIDFIILYIFNLIFKGIKIVFEFTRPIYRKIYSKSMIEKILLLFFFRCLKKAHKVILLSSLKNEFTNIFRCYNFLNLDIIHDGVNIELFKPQKPDNRILVKYNLKDSFILCYVGSLHVDRNISFLIKSFYNVSKSIDNLKLILIGFGNDFNNLKTLVNRLGLNNKVILTGYIPYDKIPKFINLSNVCLCIIPPKKEYITSFPLKLLEYMSCNKIIIANKEIIIHKKIFEKCKFGYLISYNEEELSNIIINCFDNKFSLSLSNQPRDFIIGKYDYKTISLKIERIYDNILKRVLN
ncbi:MAG: glycosyltransferase [Candidatus Helarchaeota archaeon]